jgi:crotonobetainyl-CoA:carnitine CoA-transferase CaiB-like acyl-CoA transferase
MSSYSRLAYDELHQGIRVTTVNLKTEPGQSVLHRELARAHVLLTSFRPGALTKLGLDWKTLHKRYPALSMVAIFGALKERAEEPGHDLTYQAENNLITGLNLPATLYADMGGALNAYNAILQAVLLQRQSARGRLFEVALADAAAYLALPHRWGVTLPGTVLGGGHAGYRVYPCQDGRVAMAALEVHFAKSLCDAAGIKWAGPATMLAAPTHEQIAGFLLTRTCKALEAMAIQHDIPLHTLLNS